MAGQHTHYDAFYVARQPIFGPDRSIWGYELLFRASGLDSNATVENMALATSKVIADGFLQATKGISRDKKICINFSSEQLFDGTAEALPKDRVVIEIMENVPTDLRTLTACRKLKKAGYTIALDNYEGQDERTPFLDIVSIVKIPMHTCGGNKAFQLRQQLEPYGCTLLATRVEDWRHFEATKFFGYQLFQGYFFARPEVVPGRKLPPGALATVRLLQELVNEDVEVDQLAAILSTDPSLSYRLLRFINSVGFSLVSEVNSLSHAISLLGLVPFKKWALVVAMADLDASEKGSELTFMELQRAFFLQTVAENQDKPCLDPSGMFLLGLFSKMDALLGLPMEEVLADLPLPATITQGLLSRDNEAGTWISLLEALETGDWDTFHARMDELDILGVLAAGWYLTAGDHAAEALGVARER
ncbi:MAG: EAL and HDOD domain-containing protein [Desulfovibrionaceae bacterium]